MIHVSVTIKKVSLQGRPWFFLPFPSHSSFILIISVTVVPERIQQKSKVKCFHKRFEFRGSLLLLNIVMLTRMIHVAPRVLSIPNRSQIYKIGFCIPYDCNHHPFQSSPLKSKIKCLYEIHMSTGYLVNIQATITKGKGHTAFWTFLGVGGDPVWRFWIIIAFLNPLFNKMTPHWIMPSFWTCETKEVATSETLKTSLVWILSKNYMYKS